MTPRFFLMLAAAVMATAPASAIPFHWYDPNQHPRVILDADQSLVTDMNEHPEWFQNDFLVASFYITNVTYGQFELARRDYGMVRNKLWSNRIQFGSYVSGTTAVPELMLNKFPSDAVSIEDLSVKTHYLGPWIRQPEQQVVDLSDLPSRQGLQGRIERLWEQVRPVIRFVDNAAVHPRVAAGMQPWAIYCQNMKELRAFSEASQGPVIFNVFVRPWEMTNKETDQLIDAVAGRGNNAISFPIPWSRTIKDDKNANAWAIYRYRQMLDHGIVLILIPANDATDIELFGWIGTWRRPTDRIYIATPYWQEPPL